MRSVFSIILTLICFSIFGQNPVIIDIYADTIDWGKDPDAKEILRLIKKMDSIDYYRKLEEKKKNELHAPKIQFATEFKITDVRVKIWNDKVLVVDRYVGKERATFGPFEAGHFYDIEYSKEDYVTKRVFVSAIGIKDSLPMVTINVTLPMIERKKFKLIHEFRSWDKSNPFKIPAARALPDIKGFMYFDMVYIEKRKAVIREFYKKKYKPIKE